jgi:uncharacterized membrane protein YqiK
MLTHEAIRARLRAMQVEINNALTYTADGRYELALECVAALDDCDRKDVAAALERLAADNPSCSCSSICGDCAPIDVAEWS